MHLLRVHPNPLSAASANAFSLQKGEIVENQSSGGRRCTNTHTHKRMFLYFSDFRKTYRNCCECKQRTARMAHPYRSKKKGEYSADLDGANVIKGCLRCGVLLGNNACRFSRAVRSV